MEIAGIQFLRIILNYGAENCSERKLSVLIMNIFERFFCRARWNLQGKCIRLRNQTDTLNKFFFLRL